MSLVEGISDPQQAREDQPTVFPHSSSPIPCLAAWFRAAHLTRFLGCACWLQSGSREAASRHSLSCSFQIGRAACRERVCPYVLISVSAVAIKKQNKQL